MRNAGHALWQGSSYASFGPPLPSCLAAAAPSSSWRRLTQSTRSNRSTRGKRVASFSHLQLKPSPGFGDRPDGHVQVVGGWSGPPPPYHSEEGGGVWTQAHAATRSGQERRGATRQFFPSNFFRRNLLFFFFGSEF
jgi:hypothetical protein